MKQLYKDLTFIALAVLAGMGFLTLAQAMTFSPSYTTMFVAVVLMSDSLNSWAKYLTSVSDSTTSMAKT